MLYAHVSYADTSEQTVRTHMPVTFVTNMCMRDYAPPLLHRSHAVPEGSMHTEECCYTESRYGQATGEAPSTTISSLITYHQYGRTRYRLYCYNTDR